MTKAFGWDYPAGAENDPRAPWNQPDCLQCGDTGQTSEDGEPCPNGCEIPKGWVKQ